MKRVVYTFVLFFLSLSVFAQEQSDGGVIDPQFSLDYLHGNVLKAKDIEGKNGSNYIQLSATMKTGTQDGSFFNWYRKPEVGISGLYGYLGKTDVLGSVFALYPTWRYSFFEGHSIGLNVKLGSGFAWFTNPHDKIDNPDNLLIGSHFTNITELSLGVWFEFVPECKIEAGVTGLHFSNGHTAIPNYGLNDITAKLGVIYTPGVLSNKTTRKRTLPTEFDDTWKKTIAFTLGRHELAYSTKPVDGPNYNIYKLYVGLSKRLTKINEVQFGVSAAYYESYHTFIHLSDYYEHLQHLGATVWTAHVGHEFLINRFGLVTELGIKVIDKFYRDYFMDRDWEKLWYKGLFAPKAGFKFYPIWNSFDKQKLALGMFIKTNGFQADCVEYSLSYTF